MSLVIFNQPSKYIAENLSGQWAGVFGPGRDQFHYQFALQVHYNVRCEIFHANLINSGNWAGTLKLMEHFGLQLMWDKQSVIRIWASDH